MEKEFQFSPMLIQIMTKVYCEIPTCIIQTKLDGFACARACVRKPIYTS